MKRARTGKASVHMGFLEHGVLKALIVPPGHWDSGWVNRQGVEPYRLLLSKLDGQLKGEMLAWRMLYDLRHRGLVVNHAGPHGLEWWEATPWGVRRYYSTFPSGWPNTLGNWLQYLWSGLRSIPRVDFLEWCWARYAKDVAAGRRAYRGTHD